MIRNYLKMLLGLPVLLFAGNCCLGSSTADVEINAYLTVDQRIRLNNQDNNVTVSAALSRDQSNLYGLSTAPAYSGKSNELQITSNIANLEKYKISCRDNSVSIPLNGGGSQKYIGYVYQNNSVNGYKDIMSEEVEINRDRSDDSNTTTFQLLFVLPNGVNYKTGTHSSTTTCTISA
ncbi:MULTISPECIES: hypothetical protein [Cysteiniphilum]|uniref:Uncharacterized protein n=1 Tax=Cysteiniphilum litorale TaxID=2056700 RepID=A0A8J2Z3G3_9GAMM|nr:MULTISPECIES: hypothetical protein [Cysteiniphilum]GGF93591.1 hypothetical protein GCM10010995_08450 [Cysteiniphilum litorale]